jgi:hypothetical protein
MAILGIESVRFRVEDMDLSTRFFDDLALSELRARHRIRSVMG